MPYFCIALNGDRLATVDLAELNVFDVSIHGALDQLAHARLDAAGGNFSEGGSGYLTWIAERSLLPGQELSVTLLEAGQNPDRGKNAQELFPGEEPCTETDFSITDEMAAELRARPRLHDAFAVQAQTSTGEQATAASDERNTSYAFRVVWNWLEPSQARVSLATGCLDDVLAKRLGTMHLETMIPLGASANFSLTR